jgi:hypothetical protein
MMVLHVSLRMLDFDPGHQAKESLKMGPPSVTSNILRLRCPLAGLRPARARRPVCQCLLQLDLPNPVIDVALAIAVDG